MSASDVFHKDILDVRRANIVWYVTALYVLLTALFVYWARQNEGFPEIESEILLGLWNLIFIGAVFVPAVALVAAYLAIAGERESGSIKYLLSTPIRRRDVVLGKYLSRASIVAVAILFSFVVGAGLATVWYGSIEVGPFVGVGLLTTLYALAYVSVAIAISAATASRGRAMGVSLAFYFVTNVFVVFEGLSVLSGIEYLLNDLLGLGVGEDPVQFLGMVISPTHAYFGTTIWPIPDSFLDAVETPTPDELVWYLQPEVALFFLLAWTIVPLLLGVWRFERVDLG